MDLSAFAWLRLDKPQGLSRRSSERRRNGMGAPPGFMSKQNMTETTEPTALREMPRYKCHKEVWALKIKSIVNAPPTCPENWAALEIEDEGFTPVTVDDKYMAKHKPEAGGFYVVYSDGYKSYSPAKAFEDGYTKLKVSFARSIPRDGGNARVP